MPNAYFPSSMPCTLKRFSFHLLVLSIALMVFLVAAPTFAGCFGGGKANRQARREARRAARVGYATTVVESYRATYRYGSPPAFQPTYPIYSVPFLGIAGPSCATGQCPAR